MAAKRDRREVWVSSRTDAKFGEDWLEKLVELRQQGMEIADINPVSALADIIGGQIDSGAVSIDQIGVFLDGQAKTLWARRVDDCLLYTSPSPRD